MRSSSRKIGALASFMIVGSLCASVYGQQPAQPLPSQSAPLQPAPPAAPTSEAPAVAPTGRGWNGECPERQELREEREKIRSEHEELESVHDNLKVQCMDAKGQDRSSCRARFQDWHDRSDALHERMKALHDRVEADPGCHREHKDATPWPAREAPPSVNPAAQ